MARSLPCPYCGYDLRAHAAATSSPICPECGATVSIGRWIRRFGSPTRRLVTETTLLSTLIGLVVLAIIATTGRIMLAGVAGIVVMLTLNVVLLVRRDRRLLAPALLRPLASLLLLVGVCLVPCGLCFVAEPDAPFPVYSLGGGVLALLVGSVLFRIVRAQCFAIDRANATPSSPSNARD